MESATTGFAKEVKLAWAAMQHGIPEKQESRARRSLKIFLPDYFVPAKAAQRGGGRGYRNLIKNICLSWLELAQENSPLACLELTARASPSISFRVPS